MTFLHGDGRACAAISVGEESMACAPVSSPQNGSIVQLITLVCGAFCAPALYYTFQTAEHHTPHTAHF